MKRKKVSRVLESSSEDEDSVIASIAPVLPSPPSRASQPSQSPSPGITLQSPRFGRSPSIIARLEEAAPLSPIHIHPT